MADRDAPGVSVGPSIAARPAVTVVAAANGIHTVGIFAPRLLPGASR